MSNGNDEDNGRHLARRISQVLEQPAPRAPAALQQSVLAEISRRAARPWWQRQIAQWPLAARTGLLVGGGILATWLLRGPRGPGWHAICAQLAAVLSQHMPQNVPRLSAALSAAATLDRAGAALMASIPGPWLQGGLVLATVLYAALFALVTLACRLLGRQTFATSSMRWET